MLNVIENFVEIGSFNGSVDRFFEIILRMLEIKP